MRYKGRHIDAAAFWERYVEFPSGAKITRDDTFLPKVQCPNPDHDTLKRHFQVNAQQPYVHCFAHCGISGSWEHAICMIEGLYEKFKVDLVECRKAWDKKPAKRSNADREQLRRYQRAHRAAEKIILRAASGISSKPHITTKHTSPPESATAIPADLLSYDSFLPAVALEYLTERGISKESVAAWEIGWLADDKRIVIPGKDERGIVRFLIKRGILPSQQPKYLYWPEKELTGWGKTDVLFGACQIDLGMIKSDGLILAEGSIGAIKNHQDALRNTTAILGTGISERQCRIIEKLKPPRIYFMFDKDSAGIVNIEIAVGMLKKYPLYVVRFPKGKSDWDDATKEEKERQISRAVPALRFLRDNGLNVRSRQKRKEIRFG
jgi:hypothetical protein